MEGRFEALPSRELGMAAISFVVDVHLGLPSASSSLTNRRVVICKRSLTRQALVRLDGIQAS